ncbi:MAG: hypothetical protein M0R80_07645 [Proteobacteria bacterium]|jgi:hypothetical protein|nr:hypothetical protein [Pseudomonadota bacterium]
MTTEEYKKKRAEATAKVLPFVIRVNQYQAVKHGDCQDLLSVEGFLKLIDDPIRGLGPIKGTIYPWNVIDYVMEEQNGVQPELSV